MNSPSVPAAKPTHNPSPKPAMSPAQPGPHVPGKGETKAAPVPTHAAPGPATPTQTQKV